MPNRSTTERGFDIYDEFESRNHRLVRIRQSSASEQDCLWIFVGDTGNSSGIHLEPAMALRIRDAINVWLREIDYQGSDEDEHTPFVTLHESNYNDMVRRENDQRFALADFMAAYGNCAIPGALMDLAHAPEPIPGMTGHDVREMALFRAWLRGAKALGLDYGQLRRAGRMTPERMSTIDQNTAFVSFANSGDCWVVFSMPGEPIVYRYFASNADLAASTLGKKCTNWYLGNEEFDRLVHDLGLPPIGDWPDVPKEPT